MSADILNNADRLKLSHLLEEMFRPLGGKRFTLLVRAGDGNGFAVGIHDADEEGYDVKEEICDFAFAETTDKLTIG